MPLDASKRKHDDVTMTGSSPLIRAVLVLTCLVCGSAALFLFTSVKATGDRPTARLTYMSSGISYALNLQTGESLPLGVMPDPFYAPPLSPDGRWTASWEAITPDESQITIAESGTQRIVNRYTVPAAGSRLSWAYDSQWLLLAARATQEISANTDLWLMNRETGERQRLTQTPELEIDPLFSPDGTQIAYITIDHTGSHTLYVMDMRTRTSQRLSTQQANRPAWSPDGQWIAFESSADGTTSQIAIIRPNGTDFQTVTDGRTFEHTPLWIP